MSVLDVQYIQASFNVWLAANFTGNIHPGGVESPSDATWIEPWLDFTYQPTRPQERVIYIAVTVNCFAKRNQTPASVDTYDVVGIASEIADLLRNASFDVAKYGGDESVIGCGRFQDPEVVNLGTVQHINKGVPLQQWTVSAEGSVAPLN